MQTIMFEAAKVLPYKPILTAVENLKGVLDVDTVKGCYSGMAAYPQHPNRLNGRRGPGEMP